MTNFLPSIKTSFTFCIEFDFDWELSLLMLDAQVLVDVLWNDVGAMPVDIFLFRAFTLGFLQSSFDAGIKSVASFIFEENGIISGCGPGGRVWLSRRSNMCCYVIVCFHNMLIKIAFESIFALLDLQKCALSPSISG